MQGEMGVKKHNRASLCAGRQLLAATLRSQLPVDHFKEKVMRKGLAKPAAHVIEGNAADD